MGFAGDAVLNALRGYALSFINQRISHGDGRRRAVETLIGENTDWLSRYSERLTKAWHNDKVGCAHNEDSTQEEILQFGYAELHQLADSGDFFSAGRAKTWSETLVLVGPSLLHMTNNRLGLSIPQECGVALQVSEYLRSRRN